MRISEGNADLGWSQAFTGELDDVVDNVFRGSFEPWGGALRYGKAEDAWLQGS